ncbi:MAG: T9SS type A sorting domain-containing protein [Bacteroidales bacterium]|jgi:hypothetical protein|nr:T9SS type A sorting domain-containing protein [Bacteroidales bacterium]
MKKLISTLLFLFVVALLNLSAQTDVYPPTLMEPANEAADQMPDVILDWAAVGGSGGTVMYELQVDVTDAFTNPFAPEPTEFSGFQMTDLLFGQTYYWRVRAWEGTDVSDWSEVWSFTTFSVLENNKPSNGNADNDPNVELKVKNAVSGNFISGILKYEFEADTSMNFDSDVKFHGMSDTNFLSSRYLLFGEEYYWHARVFHATDTCPWSESWTFSIVAAPELDEPGDGDTDLGLATTLEWDEIEGVVDFQVQIAEDDQFTDPYGAIVEEGFEYMTDGFMTFDTEYFWRVRARHANDISDWSEVFSFTTIAAPILDSPENGELDVQVNPLLEWEEITGVDFYQVEYNNTDNFDDPCCHETVEGTDNSFQVVFLLDYETTFYWRARSIKGIDTTAWSEVWSFTTRAEDFGIEEAFDGNSINIYPNPSSGKLHIDIDGEENTEITIRVMDMIGQVQLEDKAVFSSGNSSRIFDLSNLANGMYIVNLTKGDQSYSHKITLYK